MLCTTLRKVDQFLREHQDPRYRTQPWILPCAWRGSGSGPLTKEQLARFNVKDMGLDPKVVANQPLNKALRALFRGKR